MNAAKRIANYLYARSILLDGEGDLNAIYRCDTNASDRLAIAGFVLAEPDIELVINTDDIREHGGESIIFVAAYQYARDRLTDDIDGELWLLQKEDELLLRQDAAYIQQHISKE